MELLGVGILIGLYPLTWGIFAYVQWRYSVMPFKNLAASLKAERAERLEFQSWAKNEVGLRKAMSVADSELSRQENRIQRARRAWSEEISKSAPSE